MRKTNFSKSSLSACNARPVHTGGPGGDIAPDEAQNGERLLTKALKMSGPHKERNRTELIGWLRAAVLGANDGIVSTASLVLGVAAAHGTRSNVLVAGVAGLVAGAMAMAAGEYVSVHSQADSEHAELKRESVELKQTTRASTRN